MCSNSWRYDLPYSEGGTGSCLSALPPARPSSPQSSVMKSPRSRRLWKACACMFACRQGGGLYVEGLRMHADRGGTAHACRQGGGLYVEGLSMHADRAGCSACMEREEGMQGLCVWKARA